jgi:hypothetical protein
MLKLNFYLTFTEFQFMLEIIYSAKNSKFFTQEGAWHAIIESTIQSKNRI